MVILYGFANISYSLIQLDNSKHRSRAISRLSEGSEGRKIHVLSCNIDYPSLPRSPESMFAFTTQHVVIEVPERTSDCPELKTFKKFFHKKRISKPMTRGRDGKTDLVLTLSWPGHGESVPGSLMRERFVSSDRTQSPSLLRFM